MMALMSRNSSMLEAPWVLAFVLVQTINAFVPTEHLIFGGTGPSLLLSSEVLLQTVPDATTDATTMIISTTGGSSSSVTSALLLLGLDFSAEISDAARNLVLGLTAFLLLLAAGSTYITQSFVPEQMNNLALMVRQERPDVWDEITSKLEEGERIRDRPDLMAELTNVGMTMMKEETEEDMRELIVFIQEQKKKSADIEDDSYIQEFVESTLGSSIKDFIAKVESNPESKYLTKDREELANLLKKEFPKSES